MADKSARLPEAAFELLSPTVGHDSKAGTVDSNNGNNGELINNNSNDANAAENDGKGERKNNRSKSTTYSNTANNKDAQATAQEA